MKKQAILYALLVVFFTTFSGCAVVEGIFKTGMGVGIFITVLIILIVIFAISRIFKSKK